MEVVVMLGDVMRVVVAASPVVMEVRPEVKRWVEGGLALKRIWWKQPFRGVVDLVGAYRSDLKEVTFVQALLSAQRPVRVKWQWENRGLLGVVKKVAKSAGRVMSVVLVVYEWAAELQGPGITRQMVWFQKRRAQLEGVAMALQGISYVAGMVQKGLKARNANGNGQKKEAGLSGFEAVMRGAMGYFCGTKAYGAYREWARLRNVVQKCFVLMRVAPHEEDGAVTERGKEKVGRAAREIEKLGKATGTDGVLMAFSERGYGTADELSDVLDVSYTMVPERPDQGLNGTRIRKQLKENPEQRAVYNGWTKEEKFTGKLEIEGYEAPCEVAKRTETVVRGVCGMPLDALGVVVTHQENMSALFERLGDGVPQDWREHHAVSCEVYPMQMVDGVISALGESVKV